MGKEVSDGPSAMRIDMCEQLDLPDLQKSLAEPDSSFNDNASILTINILENKEDVDVLKSNLKKGIESSENVLPDLANECKTSSTPSSVFINNAKETRVIDSRLVVNFQADNQSYINPRSPSEHTSILLSSDPHELCQDYSGQQQCTLTNKDTYLCSSPVHNTSAEEGASLLKTDTNIQTEISVSKHSNSNGFGPFNSLCQVNKNNVTHSENDQNTIAITEKTLTSASENRDTAESLNITPLESRENGNSLPLCVKETNGRLSKVLENIPLVYIPTTKQLGLADPSSHSVDSGNVDDCPAHSSSDCSDSHIEYVSDSDHTITNESQLDTRDLTDIALDNDDLCRTLHHCHTQGSFQTDTSSLTSFSSISTGTSLSFSTNLGPDSTPDGDVEGTCSFTEISLHSQNSYEPAQKACLEGAASSKDTKSKKKGLSGIFTRGIFSKKSRDGIIVDQCVESQPGWKLFGRVPMKETVSAIDKEADQISVDSACSLRSTNSREASPRTKKENVEVLSTTALILENRPSNLPSKSAEETEKHRQQYEEMVEEAKKKELRKQKQKRKQMQHQLHVEDQLVAAVKIWNTEIIPNWDSMRSSRKARELWWSGLPPSVRGRVWSLTIGNELNITHELYEICLNRAHDRIKLRSEAGDINSNSDVSEGPASSKEDSVESIQLDVSRTLPQLCIFQKGGPYYDLLHSLLGAYACYRPDVGYVQGMSFIAAVLLLNMDVADAFISFANLLNKPCQLACFRMDEGLMISYFQTFDVFFKENMPKLHRHFTELNMTPEIYLIDWMFALFSKSLPLDLACRVWDMFCRDGEEFLFRTALGILRMYEDILQHLDFFHLAQFLTKLPEAVQSEILFQCIQTIRMSIDKKRFAQVLVSFRDPSTGL